MKIIQTQNETSAYIGESNYIRRSPDFVQADEMMGMSWSTEVTGTVNAWSYLNACSQKILRNRKSRCARELEEVELGGF